MSKPKVVLNCPANSGAAQDERIVEVYGKGSGGFLVSIHDRDVVTVVEPYRADGFVVVNPPSLPETAWLDSPEFTGVTIDNAGVTGTVRVSFTRGDSAYVSTRAHVNDDAPAVTFRGSDYLVNIHLERDAVTGKWSEHREYSAYAIARRSYSDKPVAPTIRERIVTTLCSLVDSMWSEDINRQAKKAYATRNLIVATNEYHAAAAELVKLGNQVRTLRETIRDNS